MAECQSREGHCSTIKASRSGLSQTSQSCCSKQRILHALLNIFVPVCRRFEATNGLAQSSLACSPRELRITKRANKKQAYHNHTVVCQTPPSFARGATDSKSITHVRPAHCTRQVESHLTNQCPLHREPCRKGCGEEVAASSRETHEGSECVERIVRCECGTDHRYSRTEDHRQAGLSNSRDSSVPISAAKFEEENVQPGSDDGKGAISRINSLLQKTSTHLRPLHPKCCPQN